MSLSLIVLEVYQWLYNRFPNEFVEIDLCRILNEKVCSIIESILMSKNQKGMFFGMEQ